MTRSITLTMSVLTLALPVFLGSQDTDAGSSTRILRAVLNDVSRKSGVYAVAVSFLADEWVTSPPIERVEGANIEAHLKALVAKLPYPARLIKLYLPKGPAWTAEELMAYVRAERALYRKPIAETGTDEVEILAQKLSLSRAQPAIDALDLRPVYIVALKHAHFGGYWETTYGQMRLEQNGAAVTGTYSVNQGEIRGTVVGTELRFTWFEQGNATGGSGAVQLSDDGLSFAGPWWNNNTPAQPAGTWTGRRIRKDRSGTGG